MKAPAKKPKPKPVAQPTVQRIALRWAKAICESRNVRVDEENGIIYDVKICDEDSNNNRKYLREAMVELATLYEGVTVHKNHSLHGENRDIEDKTGWLEQCHYVPSDGCRGNLCFIKATNLPGMNAPTFDDFQRKVLWCAKNKPDMFALSHEIPPGAYTAHVQNGVQIVEHVTKVKSVDIVDNPATTGGLFESRQMTTKTLREVLESGKGPGKVRLNLLALAESAVDSSILEEKMCEEDEANPNTHYARGIGAAIGSGDADHHELATKIMKLLAPEKMEEEEEPAGTGTKPKAGEDEPAGKGPGEEEPNKAAAKESKRVKPVAPGAVRLTESVCKNLCELAGIAPTTKILSALQTLTSQDAAVQLLTGMKESMPKGNGAPRSQLARGLTESRSDKPFDAKAYAAGLRR